MKRLISWFNGLDSGDKVMCFVGLFVAGLLSFIVCGVTLASSYEMYIEQRYMVSCQSGGTAFADCVLEYRRSTPIRVSK